jgi:hypothetical protein
VDTQKLKLLLDGIIDASIVDRFYKLNSDLYEPQRTLRTALDVINYAILQLEAVKVGELTIDQKEKLNALKEFKNQLPKEWDDLTKPKYGVFYMDKLQKEF